jgi:hypothetical protein
MNAQLQVVSYMRPTGVFDPNIAAKRALDPKFAEVQALSNAPNNTSASWTQRVQQLFGGQAPRDRVDLSNVARAAASAAPAAPSPGTPAPYRIGSIVSTTA